MRGRKVFLWCRAVGVAVLAALLHSPPGWAQQGPILLPPQPVGLPGEISPVLPRDSTEPANALEQLLRQGLELERQGRWGDALLHYEEALRCYPAHSVLERRYEYARLHYDLVRRYSDRSFLHILEVLSPQEALGLYNEVLTKLQAHYVDTFRWQDLIERGATDMEVALSEPLFIHRYLAGQSPAQLTAFRQALRELVAQQRVDNRTAAWQAVQAVAQLAHQQLGLPPTVVILECLCGITNTLDPYSAFLTPSQLEEIYSQIEGNFVGLGIELKGEQGRLRIVRVIPDSPAQEAGLQAGDWILAVGPQSTLGLTTEQAADLLQGPEGSWVELTVQTPGQEARQVRLRRRRVEIPSIEQAQILEPQAGIAYLKLTCFQKTTARDLEAVLWDLYRQGMRSLIVDVRGNPGGLLSTAVEVADKFLDQGVIVSTRGRSPQEDFTYTAQPAGTWRVPLVVLVDRESASAAEIFASAIRDHRRGTLVGQRTYGKGSVQGIFPLGYAGTGIRLTTARFYSPTGQCFNRIGLEPDIVVHRTARVSGPSDGWTSASHSSPEGSFSLPHPRSASSGWKPAGSATSAESIEEDAALAAAVQAARQLLGRR